MRRTQNTIHPLRFLGICVKHYPHLLSTLRICLLEPQPIQGVGHKLPDPRVNRQDGIPLRQHASLNVWSQRLDFVHQCLLIVHKECAGNAFSFKNPPSPTPFASVAKLDPSALEVNAKPSGMAGDLCNPVITTALAGACTTSNKYTPHCQTRHASAGSALLKFGSSCPRHRGGPTGQQHEDL